MVQQKHFHCGLCYFLFRTPHGSTLGLPGAPHRPSGGAAGHGRALGSRAREGRGRSVSRECRGDFAMLVLLRALFSPLRWRDATWLLRSCCRVERVFFFFNVRIPANVAQIKFKLEVNRRRGGGEGGRLFPFRDPTSSLRGDQHPEPREHSLVSPTNPTLLATRNKAARARGWGCSQRTRRLGS